METRLARTSGGQKIHRSDCTQLKRKGVKVFPWKWAEDKSLERIELAVTTRNLSLCGTCKPLVGWNGPFHACEFWSNCDCATRCKAFEAHMAHQCCM